MTELKMLEIQPLLDEAMDLFEEKRLSIDDLSNWLKKSENIPGMLAVSEDVSSLVDSHKADKINLRQSKDTVVRRVEMDGGASIVITALLAFLLYLQKERHHRDTIKIDKGSNRPHNNCKHKDTDGSLCGFPIKNTKAIMDGETIAYIIKTCSKGHMEVSGPDEI